MEKSSFYLVILLVGSNLTVQARTTGRENVNKSEFRRFVLDGEAPRDCMDLLHYWGYEESGIYNVTLWKSKQTVAVSCDMEIDGGGWTVFQRRFTGALNFTRTFADYQSGFGDLNGEFWLGLKYIQEMAAIAESELRLDVKALDGTDLYEAFNNFSLTQAPGYRLYIEPGHGSIGDDPKHGLSYVYGQPFSTNDHDVSPGHCPSYQKSGWWYKQCGYINLNAHHDMKMFYTTTHGYESLKETQMMLRRANV